MKRVFSLFLILCLSISLFAIPVFASSSSSFRLSWNGELYSSPLVSSTVTSPGRYLGYIHWDTGFGPSFEVSDIVFEFVPSTGIYTYEATSSEFPANIAGDDWGL